MSEDDRIKSKAVRLRRIEHRLYNAPGGLRASELARDCGVARRTIYRDLESLQEMGVPIWEGEGRFGINRSTYLSTPPVGPAPARGAGASGSTAAPISPPCASI
ncbi:MAG: hypothetical protein OHK0015_03330 [Chloroflexi bacterium OHK40]